MANLKDINYGIGKYLEASDASSLPDIGTNRKNLDLLNFKVATENAYALYNFKDGMIDAYMSAAGVDAGTSTNEIYNAAGDYYSGTIAGDVVTAFTSTGAGTYSVPAATTQVKVLVVGGGGQGGGAFQGGGGGAGGLVYVSNYAVTGGASISLSVGAGGTGSTAGSGGVGDDSTFGILTANGGGTGGNSSGNNGYTGGSGGGGGTNSNGPGASGAASNQPASFSPYSNVGFGTSGGNGKSGSGGGDTLQAGGGGGAGGAGGNHSTGPGSGPRGGPGGIGKDYSSVFGTGYGSSGSFAGGGGGGSSSGHSGGSGSTGGGSGATGCGGGAGSANTGSGGGGTGDCGGNPPGQGGAGGSGIVLVKTVAIYNNMTLISNAQTANAAPTEGRLMLYEETSTGSTTLDTDLKGYVSRDGGTTYTQTPLTLDTTYETGKTLVSGSVDISGQPSGTNMKYKIETLNQSASKVCRIHGASMLWV